MAYHFSANQYEDQYNARKLGNWEYTKWYPERPRQRTQPTKIIANDNGHLLEGIKRENPWGNYQGTWDLPRRITREFAEKLAAPPEKLVARWRKKKVPDQDEPKTQEDTSAQEETMVGEAVEPVEGEHSSKTSLPKVKEEDDKPGESVWCAKADNKICLCPEENDTCPCAKEETQPNNPCNKP